MENDEEEFQYRFLNGQWLGPLIICAALVLAVLVLVVELKFICEMPNHYKVQNIRTRGVNQ